MTKKATKKKSKIKGYLFHGKALSIIQPWASAITYAGKDVENRTWRTNYRGPIAIHASAKCFEELLEEKVKYEKGKPKKFLRDLIYRGQKKYDHLFERDETPQSCIVAIATLSHCSEKRKSVWHMPDCWGWRIEGVVPIKPVPMKGALGVWDCKFNYEPLVMLDYYA